MIPTKVILHCSATEDGQTFSWDDIRRYHVQDRGWDDIGYHYGLEGVGGALVLMEGRKPWIMGAHCKAAGRNHDSVGICVVGNYDVEPPTLPRYAATIRALALICWSLGIDPAEVYGHREFERAKTCPGRAWDLDQVRRDVLSCFDQIDGETVLHALGVLAEGRIL